MKLAALISGGKDSVYASYLASHTHEIKYIISIVSENPESYMFHVPNIRLVKYQSEAMNIPLIQKTTKGEKEKELLDLVVALKKISNEIDGIVTGAVASVYQKSRIDNMCKKLGLKHVSPLWAKEPIEIINGMLDNNFDIIITAVAAPPLDKEWLGRKLDKRCLTELLGLNKLYNINPMGEGGEYESLVLDCPLFNKKIEILDSVSHWDIKTRSGWLEIKKVRIVEK